MPSSTNSSTFSSNYVVILPLFPTTFFTHVSPNFFTNNTPPPFSLTTPLSFDTTISSTQFFPLTLPHHFLPLRPYPTQSHSLTPPLNYAALDAMPSTNSPSGKILTQPSHAMKPSVKRDALKTSFYGFLNETPLPASPQSSLPITSPNQSQKLHTVQPFSISPTTLAATTGYNNPSIFAESS